jgi:hypothetical protein
VVLILVVLAVARDVLRFAPVNLPAMVPRAIAVALVGGTVAAHRILRASLPRGPSGDPSNWWAINAGRVIALWGVADGLAIVGAVLWFLTGDFVALTIAGGAGLFLLAANHPGRLGA